MQLAIVFNVYIEFRKHQNGRKRLYSHGQAIEPLRSLTAAIDQGSSEWESSELLMRNDCGPDIKLHTASIRIQLCCLFDLPVFNEVPS